MVLPAHIAASLAGTWLYLNSTPTDLNGLPKHETSLGTHPTGQIIYDPAGYMSASMTSHDAAHIPPDRSPNNATDDDYALMGRHLLAYAGELHVEWANSTATEGRLVHGPLTMSTRWTWLGTNQSRNYVMTRNASEVGGRDVLHLWLRNETEGRVANLWWVRAGGS